MDNSTSHSWAGLLLSVYVHETCTAKIIRSREVDVESHAIVLWHHSLYAFALHNLQSETTLDPERFTEPPSVTQSIQGIVFLLGQG